MAIKKKVYNGLQAIFLSFAKLLGKKFCSETAEKLVTIDEVDTKYGIIRYYCLGKIPLWRSRTLFSKEPETIDWIDSMNKKDTLWDIGANVGLYSVYAGLKKMQVFAFEPSSLNTFLISKNIEVNNLKDNVTLYPIAVSNKNEFGYLNMTTTELGGALNEFNKEDTLKSIQAGKYIQDVVFKQGMFSYSIDELIEKYSFEVPNYIKIDVDSIEDKIIYGAEKTLGNKNLKGLLVELDETEDRTQMLIDFLDKKGLKLIKKLHSEMFVNTDFDTQYNYIFERV